MNRTFPGPGTQAGGRETSSGTLVPTQDEVLEVTEGQHHNSDTNPIHGLSTKGSEWGLC